MTFVGTLPFNSGILRVRRGEMMMMIMMMMMMMMTVTVFRFRSVTKTYFRRADGVMLLYDVTSERSFTSVRNGL